MPRPQGSYVEETWVSRTAEAASGQVDLDGYGDSSTLRIQLDVTAVGGTTPTLDVFIEDTLDGTNYNSLATFTQKSAVSREVLNITTPFARRLRIRWVVGGTTPSLDFTVKGVSQIPSV